MSFPLVSIIIPLYNCASTVITALDSIPKRTDVQLCIVDDCSTDNTKEICSFWIVDNQDKFDSVKLLTTEQNSGCGAAKNVGYDNADGRGIWSLDGDDYFITDQANKVIDLASSCFSDIIRIDNETNGDSIWTGERPAAGAYLVNKDFLGDLRCPNFRRAADGHLYDKLKQKCPIVYVANIVAYHYNYMQEGSTTGKYSKGFTDEYGEPK